jgi:hypothetical protein
MRALLSKVLGVVCCAAVLGACDGGTGSEELDPVGTVSFTYRGAVSGSYQATGELQLRSGTLPQPATGATAYRQDSVLAVLAFKTEGGARGDGFTLVLGALTEKGSYAFDPLACQSQASGACRIGVFAPGLDAAQLAATPDAAALAANAYVLVLGSVNVTRLTELRVRGTFSGTAVRASDPTLASAVTISRGEFDVPIPPR